MQTPIADFVKEYADKQCKRFHMPGHKGQAFLGCEIFDITEVAGADALYEADGIIGESEKNAAELFETARTVYSTEGSSQCIRAMMHLTLGYWKLRELQRQGENAAAECSGWQISARPYVIAARNVHKAFLYAAALVDFDVVWLYPEKMHSLCSCEISAKQLEAELEKQIEMHQGMKPAAVYVTSPDYLGCQLEIAALADVCHKHDTLLAVDNAHGAYLHFLEKSQHPMDCGADICCDSAHKTLPVLTGGAYLHISKNAPSFFAEQAKLSMALYGSTSPSYLTMVSLDLCNSYLGDGYREKIAKTIAKLEQIRRKLEKQNWKFINSDPLKLTIDVSGKMKGTDLATYLRSQDIECEFADEKFVVFMVTPENTDKDCDALLNALERFKDDTCSARNSTQKMVLQPVRCEQKLTIRDAVFMNQEMIKVDGALGRICGTPVVGCPPAIPIAVAGELINEKAVELFKYYGIDLVAVIK